MRRLLLFICFFLSCFPAISQEHIEPFTVSGIINPLKQPKDMDCWITVSTMLLNWKDSFVLTVDQVAEKLGDPWLLYYQTNTGLPASDQERFINKIGLKAEPPANYLLSAYVEMLRLHGPLWIITGNILGAHARLLIGIDGDGSYDHSHFIFNDPASGQTVHESVLKFFRKFEAEAKIANREKWKELRIQIYHF